MESFKLVKLYPFNMADKLKIELISDVVCLDVPLATNN